MRRQAGFTILEVVFTAAIFAVLLAGVATAIAKDPESHRVIVSHLGPEMKGRTALQRIAGELRMAGVWGEDRNRNGVFDAGEDMNGNGRFDADWDLADGTVDQDTLTFNRRVDLLDNAGDVIASGVYSRPVTYLLDGERLIRRWEFDDGAGNITTRESVLAEGVAGLRFSRTGDLVTVAVDVALPVRVYRQGFRTLTTRVRLRN